MRLSQDSVSHASALWVSMHTLFLMLVKPQLVPASLPQAQPKHFPVQAVYYIEWKGSIKKKVKATANKQADRNKSARKQQADTLIEHYLFLIVRGMLHGHFWLSSQCWFQTPSWEGSCAERGNWCAQREGCILMLLPETLALFRLQCCHEQCQARARMSSFPSGGTKITRMGFLKPSKARTTSLLLL